MEGRFVSGDPIGFDGGINLYAYVRNNPVTLNDPLGLLAGSGGSSWSSPPPGGSSWYPPSNGTTYCGTYSKAICMAADQAAIYSVIVTAASGGTSSPVTVTTGIIAKAVSVANGAVTATICGPSASTVTTAVGAVAPGWWGATVTAIDAALTAAGY